MNLELARNQNLDPIGHIEAYCFFKNGALVKTLNKADFESYLEGDQALTGWERMIPAVFIVANQHQLIQSAVMFYLPVDPEGYVLQDWFLPLKRMADTAGRGPNLGGGRIRLACYSQCSISWHKDSLWDPATSTFVAIKKAVQLGFGYLQDVAPYSDSLSLSVQQNEVAYSDVLKRALRNEVVSYRNQTQILQQELEKQKLVNERLHWRLKEIDNQANTGNLDLTALRQQNQTLQQKVRELEVISDRLRADLQCNQHEDDTEGSNTVIDKMMLADIVSVVYHHGVGHINLSPSDILEYLEDPLAYAAHQVALSKEQYLAWLEHHRNARCQVCDDRIVIIADPNIFDHKRDIYCERHKPS